MKLFLALVIFLAATSAFAADKWDKTDIALQGTAIVLHVMDWRQTRYIAENPDRYHELNPILGNHPSKSQVDIYNAVRLLGQVTIAHYLPSKWRKIWLGTWIGISGLAVNNNRNIGIGIRW